ncbi:sodium-dependent glucose transporter 1A-like [Glandiceps talaboti]
MSIIYVEARALHSEEFSNISSNESSVFTREDEGSLLYIPYLFLSVVYITVSALFLWLYCKVSGGRILLLESAKEEDTTRFSRIDESLRFRYTILSLMCVFILIYVGNEGILNGLLYTFAMKSGLGFTPQSASFLVSLFWAGVCLSRGMAVFFAQFLHPRTMLAMDLVGCCLSATVLAIWADSVTLVLWVGAISYAVSMASVWPALITWAERYIKVNGKATALFLVAVSFTYLFYPWLVGILIGQYSIMSMMYLLLSLSVGSLIMFGILQTVASKCGRRGGTSDSDECAYDDKSNPEIIYFKEQLKTDGVTTTV